MKEAKKITMGLGDKEGGKNIGPKINQEAVDAWLSKFPKNEGVGTSKGNRLKNEVPSSVKEKQIAAATKDLEDTYPPEEKEEIVPVIIENENIDVAELKKNGVLHSIKGNLKKLGITLGLLSASSAAFGQQGPNVNQKADQDFASTGKNKIEYTVKNNETKPDLTKARKVPAFPEGYNEIKTVDSKGKRYAMKVEQNSKKLEMAKSGGPQGDNSKFIIEKLQQGITPDELVRTGHASVDGIKAFEQYYKPSTSEDIVYIEQSKGIDQYAAYAITGEGVYMPGEAGHNTGQISYVSRLSKNIQESGGTVSDKEDFVMRFEDGNGKLILTDSAGNYYPGGFSVKIKALDKNKYFDISGKHLLPGALEALQKLAQEQWKEFKNKDKVQQLGPDYTTRADTIKLPGSKIEGK